MKNKTEKPEWKLVPHFHQIADTGDYDGHYEITNGIVSIFTKDDGDDGLEAIVKALNDSECEFKLDDSKEFELHLEKKLVKEKNEEIDMLRKKLDEGRTYLMGCGDSITDSDALEAFGFGRNGLNF
jgi:hypothetical protein